MTIPTPTCESQLAPGSAPASATPPQHVLDVPAGELSQQSFSPSTVSKPVASVAQGPDSGQGLQLAPTTGTLVELSQFFKEMRKDAKQEREETEDKLRAEMEQREARLRKELGRDEQTTLDAVT